MWCWYLPSKWQTLASPSGFYLPFLLQKLLSQQWIFMIVHAAWCYFCSSAPADCGDGAQYITQYTVICLWLKFLLSFEAHSGSVLKWSSSSGKNWKPFHLRGLKGSKEHQITLPVVVLSFPPPQKLVTNCTFVGLGLCQAGAGGLPSGSDFGDPVSFKMGSALFHPLTLGPKRATQEKQKDIWYIKAQWNSTAGKWGSSKLQSEQKMKELIVGVVLTP